MQKEKSSILRSGRKKEKDERMEERNGKRILSDLKLSFRLVCCGRAYLGLRHSCYHRLSGFLFLTCLTYTRLKASNLYWNMAYFEI
jgi:hypothetical protein